MQGLSARRVNPRMSSPSCPQWRLGYNEEDCTGGSKARSGLTTLQMLLYHRVWHHNKTKKQHMEEWMHSPWSTKMAFWCWDTLSFSLSPSFPLSLRPTPTRAALLGADELKVCQLAGWEGRRERHQKEFVQRVFPITRLFTLPRVFDGWFGSSLRLSPSFLLTDYPLHDLVNLDSVSFHSKNMNHEYGRLQLLRECWQPSPAQQCFLGKSVD